MLYQLSYVRVRIILAGDTARLLAAHNASRTRRAVRPETEVRMHEQALGRRRESGQTMTEYAVILGVITPGIILALAMLSDAVQAKVEAIIGLFS